MATRTHGSVIAFDQTKDDWTSYSERLGHYFIANDVATDAKKRSILLSECGPATYKLLRSLVGAERLTTDSYADLVTALKSHYDPKPSVIVQRYKFNSRNRPQGESVAKYVAALRSLAEHFNYADVLNDMLRDRLVCGVNHEKIQQRLLAEKDLTFAKAMELASAIKSAEQGSHAISRGQAAQGSVCWQSNTQQQQPRKKQSNRPRPVREQREHPGSHKNKPKLVCWRCGDEHKAPDCRIKEAECHRCKKPGQLSKMCGKVGLRKKAHHLDLDENEDAYFLFSVRSKALEDAMRIGLTLNGVPVTMELDTGAALSLINKSTYQKIAQASQLNPLQPTPVQLKTYTGEC